MDWPDQFKSLATDRNIPGLAAAVTDRDDVRWTVTSGRTAADGTPIDDRTIFSLQSISKLYTATVVLCAVRDGLVDLDTPIRTYLPEFTVQSAFEDDPVAKITLRRLLSHTAGFTHEAPLGNNYDGATVSFDEHAATIPRTWLRFPVGARYEYSNLGIDVAAVVVQTVSGRPFEAYAEDVLLRPLGLAETTFDQSRILSTTNRAIGHQPGVDIVPAHIPIVPSGGLYTSLRDAVRFVQFFLRDGEGLIPPELLAEQRRPQYPVRGQTGGYGLGLAHANSTLIRAHGHSGGGFGFLSDMYWSREHDIGGVTLNNTTGPNTMNVIFEAMADEAGIPALAQPPTAKVEVSAEVLERHEGSYVGRNFAFTLELDGKELTAKVGQAVIKPAFVGSDEAVVLGFGRFRLHADRIVSLLDGSTFLLNDRPDDPPGPSERDWERHTGDYEVRSWSGDATVTFAILNGHPYWRWINTPWLRLTEHQPGLFFTCTGEALDLRTEHATYASIPIHATR